MVEAYQRLRDEGLVEARTGSGTVVAALPGTAAGETRSAAVRARPGGPQSDSRLPLLPAEVPAGAIDLSPGVPDLSAFPRAAWLRAERAVLDGATGSELGYGDPRGSHRLRAELAEWLARTRGIRTDADSIIVVAGVAQALGILAQTLVRRGVTDIAVEDPGSRGARDQVAHWGMRPVGVAVDEDGLRVDELSAAGVDVALVTPAHQFPTGVVLTPERRRELAAWARGGGLVLEDDYDAEHRYDRVPVPALHASAPDRVAHTGSTSKTLAPGLRLGWLVPPPELRDELVDAKHATDLGCPILPQLVLAELLASGAYDRHLRLVRTRQRARRDALVAALAEHLPQARISGVAAGLHLVATLPGMSGEIDDLDLAQRITASGVLVHPLSWHRMRPGAPGLVLGYAAHTPDRLREAARRLAATVTAARIRTR